MSNDTNRRRGASRLVGSGALLVLVACMSSVGAAAEAPFVIDSAKRRAITQDVLSSQRDPRGRAAKLDALKAYERFVMEDLSGRSALRAEAMHTLGDLYTEIETAADRTPRAKTAPPPARSRAKSIAVYERLLAQYPKRAENDGALYQLARGYWESGRLDDATAALRRVLAEYPPGAYAPEAAFRLGLRAFAARDFKAAASLFERASRGQDPSLAEAARFHLGWTALNLQEYRKAADAFVAILDATTAKQRQGGVLSVADMPEAEAAFFNEVVKALLLAFDYQGGPDEMRAYFTGSERRPYEETLYRTLGALYQEQDRTADAVAAYQAFLLAAPLHPNAPKFQSAIADAYTRAKWQGPLIEARERLVEQYTPGTSWTRANPEAWTHAAQPLVKDALYQLALYDHAQAQQSRRPAAWDKALARHDRFLALFPKDVEAPRMVWLRGEALFELGRYADAADAYRRSAYDYPLHPQTRDAAYAAVAARDRLIPADGPVAADLADRLAGDSTQFVGAYPDDTRNPDLLMKAADTALRAGRPESATDLARRLVKAYPTSRWTATANRLIGQGLYDSGRFGDAEQAFRRALSGANAQQSATVAALAASSLYQAASRDRTAGRDTEAIAGFVRLASDYPSTTLAPAALNEAAELHARSGKPADASALWQRLAEQYADSPEAPGAFRRLAASAETSGDLAAAIKWYGRLAERSEPGPRDELTWTIAALAEQARDWPRAEQTLSALAARSDLPPDRAIEAGFRAGRAAANQRRTTATALTDAALARYRVWRGQPGPHETTQADVLAAQTLVALGDQQAAACAAVRLKDPLEQSLAQKRAALNAALAVYAEAAEIKIAATTTEATHKIGEVLNEFFHALLASDRPGNLTEEQLEQYNFLIEEQAAPFEERAVSAYETNVRRTQELGLSDAWITESYERLADLRPARYRRSERLELLRRSMEAAP
ncbi:MAG TPA: tetratricopeptide repeat protein [Nitrospiria bacterium]|nr:tetratricopeptide repeat protein [Nitrospiria bacterium]